jgi:hypothetical protein
MIGMTDRERELAAAAQGPGTGMCLAIADLELHWENHRGNAPDIHELRANIRISGDGSPADRLAALKAVADWLGVPVTERYGVYHAQRRFGTDKDSIILEAHFTPDQDRTHALIRDAIKRREAVPEAEDTAELAGAA